MRKVIVAVALLALSACADGGVYQGSEQISRAKFGPAWPLSVDSGELRCEGREGVRLATFATGGEVYALNARAHGKREGVDLAPIWAPDGDRPGLRRDLAPLIDRALELCVPPSPSPIPPPLEEGPRPTVPTAPAANLTPTPVGAVVTGSPSS